MDHQPSSSAPPTSPPAADDSSFQLDDFALADSFINFDYQPDTQFEFEPDTEFEFEPTPQLASVVSDPLADSPIEERIEQISLVDNDEELEEGEFVPGAVNVDAAGGVDVRNGNAAEISSSETTTTNDSYELEEGEILDSDASAASTDDEDSEERRGGDDRSEARSQNDHQILPMIPRVNVTLGPHHRMHSVGFVKSILGADVIVEGMGNHEPLNLGSILWITRRRRPLGFIDDIIGQVKCPYYLVRFNSENEIPEGVCNGASISFVPEFASHVHKEDLYKKGYDVSSFGEEEDEIEFSDDEKEAEFMRMQRGKSRQEGPSNGGSSSTLPGHGHCSPIYRTGKRLAGATDVNPPFPHAPGMRNETTHLHAPGMPLPGHGQFSHSYGTGQGLVGAVIPPFLHASVGPNFWGNGTTLLHAPAMPLHANGHYSHAGSNFPLGGVWTNGVPAIPHQLLVPGFPHQFQQNFNPAQGFPAFQQQLNPGQLFPPATVYTGVLQPPFQPPMQFNPGSSVGRGRSNLRGRTLHHGGRKGWRPPM